jgi:hypothetical protein
MARLVGRQEEVMATRSLVAARPPSVLDLDTPGRRAAQAAAGLSVGGIVTLGLFFAFGEPWGTIVPIAVGLARRDPGSLPIGMGAIAEVTGAAVTSTFTALLIARRMTFEESLPGVLAGQALIGCWLILAGLAAWSEPASRRTSSFGIAGGAGLIATAVGIATGGMASPLAFAGYTAGVVGTIGFYTLLGRRAGR